MKKLGQKIKFSCRCIGMMLYQPNIFQLSIRYQKVNTKRKVSVQEDQECNPTNEERLPQHNHHHQSRFSASVLLPFNNSYRNLLLQNYVQFKLFISNKVDHLFSQLSTKNAQQPFTYVYNNHNPFCSIRKKEVKRRRKKNERTKIGLILLGNSKILYSYSRFCQLWTSSPTKREL